MRLKTLRPLVVLPLLALSLSGCIWPFRHHHPVKARALAAQAAPSDALPDDGLYMDARAAIMRRDYATALEALQAANERSANDVRVLNAFGVVYDKLGRFDLGERYYAMAAKLDPASPIIANNLKYSGWLRRGTSPDSAFVQADPAPAKIARPADTLYAQAVSAITSGDNGRALDLLREADGGKAKDVRTLNALGVVYARLGRYDLSERYYQQAAKLDPNSPVLANNLAMAARLRSGAAEATDKTPAMVVATAGADSKAQRAAP